MNNPIFSLLHATRWRPEKAIACMRLWMSRAEKPENIEYLFAYEKDDVASDVAIEKELEGATDITFGSVAAIRGAFGGSSPAWDAAYRASTGDLLVQVSDDFVPPEHWDVALLARLPLEWEKKPIVIAVNDGLRRDKMLTMLVCTRAYAELAGEFLHKGYQGVFSDSEATARAYLRHETGLATVIEARDLLFEHQHHCKTGAPEDDTYKHQNSPEAYEKGRALFIERNPKAGSGYWL